MVDKDIIIDIVIPIIVAIMASSGFWMLLEKSFQKRSHQTQLLIGLAHDRIVWLGMYYMRKGSITHEEYENLSVFLYAPYEAMGGNGFAKRIMEEVNKLPIVTSNIPLMRKDVEKEIKNGIQ